MKNKNSSYHWIVDLLLFIAFLLTYSLNFTGLSLHQLLGIAVGLAAGYHLLLHWNWVKAVLQRFFGKTSAQSRAYFVINLLLVAGFLAIIFTGIVISTWLNLDLVNYAAWYAVHIVTSIGTLALLLVKIGLHWRWIAAATRKMFKQRKIAPVMQPAPQAAGAARTMDRREFIKVMIPASLFTVAALSSALKALEANSLDSLNGQSLTTVLADAPGAAAGQAASTQQAVPATEMAVVQPTQGVIQPTATAQAQTACTYRCPHGRHCSYPGRCRLYTDTNQNNRCDLGECL